MGLLSKVFGGSKTGGTQDPASVWGGQSPYLAGLYQRAQNASLGYGSGGYGPAPGAVTPYQPAGRAPIKGETRTQYRNRMRYGGGGMQAGGQPQPAYATGVPTQGSQQYGSDPLTALGQSLTQQGQGMLGQLGMLGQVGNPFAMGQIGQLGQGLGRLFEQSIAPTINSQFMNQGGLGGSRQALGLGQAAEGLGQSFTSGAMDILGNSANLALQANQAGLGGLGNVFGAGNMGVFGSLPMLADILGGPTVLGGGGTNYGRTQGAILGPLTGGMTNAAGTAGIGF
jgi:hypothetical protein